MPTYPVTDWAFGPMGPGFFILFRRTADVWSDGGPMHAGLEEDDLGREDDELSAEVLALMVLLRARC